MNRNLSMLFIFTISSVFKLQAGPIAEGADKFLGNIVSSSPPSNFDDYWNQLTLENNGKWDYVESSRDNMNWSSVEAAYTYAKEKGFPYKHHTFVWGQQAPGWINGLSESEQKAEVEELMQAFGQKFPETDFIDVVNEPLNNPPSYKNAIGGDGVTGWDWVVWSFETARKHCPNAKLLINEYEIEYHLENASKYLEIINILKGKNLIDGIGIQCHTNEIQRDKPTVEIINECLDTLASSGVPLYPSELDLKGDDSTQLADYQRLFPVFWEHPSVKGVTLWGYMVPTWISGTELISNGTERPALKWLREYVAEHKETSMARTTKKVETSASSVRINYVSRGSICVHLASAQDISMRVFDSRGRILVLQKNLFCPSGDHTISFTTNSLGQGLYLIIVEGERISLIRKFFIGS